MTSQVIPAEAVDAAAKGDYLVAILGDLEAGDGYEPLGTFQVSAPHQDAAIDAAFIQARAEFPDVGGMNLSWVKPVAGHVVAGGDIRFVGGAL